MPHRTRRSEACSDNRPRRRGSTILRRSSGSRSPRARDIVKPMRSCSIVIALGLFACSACSKGGSEGTSEPAKPGGSAVTEARPVPKKPVDTKPLPPLADDPGGAHRQAAARDRLRRPRHRLGARHRGRGERRRVRRRLLRRRDRFRRPPARSPRRAIRRSEEDPPPTRSSSSSAPTARSRGRSTFGATARRRRERRRGARRQDRRRRRVPRRAQDRRVREEGDGLGRSVRRRVRQGRRRRSGCGTPAASTATARTPSPPRPTAAGSSAARSRAPRQLRERRSSSRKGGTDAMLIKLAGERRPRVGQAVRRPLRRHDPPRRRRRRRATSTSRASSSDSADWGGPKPLNAAGGSDNDVVLAKYDLNGDHVWSKRFGNAFNDVAGGLAVDPAGNVTIVGSFDKQHLVRRRRRSHLARRGRHLRRALRRPPASSRGRARTAPSATTSRRRRGRRRGQHRPHRLVPGLGRFRRGRAVTSKGNKDVFVIKLDAKGALVVGRRRWGDKDHDQGRAVAIDDKGAAHVVGLYRFTARRSSSRRSSRVRAEGDRDPEARHVRRQARPLDVAGVDRAGSAAGAEKPAQPALSQRRDAV